MSFFQEFAVPPDVLRVFERVLPLPYPILFDSATATPVGKTMTARSVARYSFVAADPWAVVRARGLEVIVTDRCGRTIVHQNGRALDIVDRMLQDKIIANSATSLTTADDMLPPFHGGAAGYIGYEYGGVLECIPKAPHDDLAIPDVVLGLYAWVIAWDHARERAWVIGEDTRIVDELVASLSSCDTSGEDDSSYRPLDPADAGDGALHETGTSTFTQRSYEAAVTCVQEYIHAGEVFQVNLSQRFVAPLRGTPWAMYRRLRAINPAPFAAYFDFGDGVIVSASPERFLHMNAERCVETRPIKGTRPRAAILTEDLMYRDALLQSTKDAAEHVMIVDVLRNDLSRVCVYGSVRVPALMTHEPYATVHHLVSTITGQLRPGLGASALIHAAFPGGSITGAPKIRAMEIIAEVEPVTRGVYCGTIGYISTTGALDTSIVIRTAVIKDGCVYYSVGGGIVADSDPTAEYHETLVKGRALAEALCEHNSYSPFPVIHSISFARFENNE